MIRTRHSIWLGALLVSGRVLTAQGAPACAALQGPGAAFGVTSYQCASCGFTRDEGARPEYAFNAEPLVMKTTTASALRAGDVVEAVNGHPITTRAGSDQFAYPRPGATTIMVRRGGARTQVTATAADGCSADAAPRMTRFGRIDPNDIENVEVIKGSAAAMRYGSLATNGVILITTKRGRSGAPRFDVVVIDSTVAGKDQAAPGIQLRAMNGPPFDLGDAPLLVVDGVVQSPPTPGGRFGFAISCLPSCSRARASTGVEYWKFDAHPPIVALREGGVAATTGLRVGDVIVEIDGLGITGEAGALRFMDAERRETIQVTVQREGKRIEYQLRSR